MANATPWKTNDWFVSEWNYAPEVTKDFKFAKNIKIHDVTLRDGEQQTGVILSKDEKIRIAEGAGRSRRAPHRSRHADRLAVRQRGDQGDRQAQSRPADLLLRPLHEGRRAARHRHRRQRRRHGNPLVSKHMVDLAYRWPMEKAIETSIEATAFAHKNGLEVVFFPIDFSRAELKWAHRPDREGRQGRPHGRARLGRHLRRAVAARHEILRHARCRSRIKKRLEAHFHQDFGMGVANTIMALSLGVEVMHTTVLGIGERSGNAPMEEIVMALKTMYGVDVGIDSTKLTPLANLVQRLTGVVVPTNKAIVGSGLYQIESGIIASWFKNCGEKNATELFPIRWSAVGQPPAEVVMGKGSGIDSVNMWLKDVGMQVSEEDAMKVLQAVKLHSLTNKKMLSHAEFRDVARATLGRTQQAAE